MAPSIELSHNELLVQEVPRKPNGLRVAARHLPSSLPPLPDESGAENVQEVDLGTPDNWVKRDGRIIRLTGKHPLNSEPPLQLLYDTGFLTPASLFYVRSHGAVPMIDKIMDEWTVEISGLVQHPITFTVADLKAKFEVVTLPVTLVCAGNRRKEQNVVSKGLGFNWGAAGLSNALFTGVYLSDVLDYVKPARSEDGRKPQHVVFEGVDKLPNGPYGTSQRLGWAKDKNRGMLLSWAMNGLPLTPDHGYPLRLVVPGQIGGRSVKWLHKIEISDLESQHHLHFWDNKLLPTEVNADRARAEAHWWYNPKYVINDLNVNSAIVYPAHDEVLPASATGMYLVRGYAYSGGGKRVTRVELSFDEGETWALTEIKYPEDLYRDVVVDDSVFGKLDLTDSENCFCWCFWSLEVDVNVLKASGSIQLRAMDEGLLLQQRDMYWNATSMMNNWWFRVAIHQSPGGLRFEHPTMAGNQPGGWMQRMKDEGLDILKPTFVNTGTPMTRALPGKTAEVSMTNPTINRKITREELMAHDSAEEPWFVVQGEVYDSTGFLDEHPGGGDSITGVAGQDATEDFIAIHSPDGRAKLAKFHIGTLVESEQDPKTTITKASALPTISTTFLSKSQWKKATLTEVKQESYNTRHFTFSLESNEQDLGLPIGQHIFVRMRGRTGEGDLVQRAYTPVSLPNARGTLELLIKLYLPNEHFPAGGKMSCLFDKLQVGDAIEVKGPVGSFTWLGDGLANWKGAKKLFRNVGMICGGSGITPILQVLRGILLESEDVETRAWVVCTNKTEEDILCRKELEEFARLHSQNNRFSLHYTLNAPPPDWIHSQGRITKAMFETYLPPPSDDSVVLICGPSGMVTASKNFLADLGWDVGTKVVVF